MGGGEERRGSALRRVAGEDDVEEWSGDGSLWVVTYYQLLGRASRVISWKLQVVVWREVYVAGLVADRGVVVASSTWVDCAFWARLRGRASECPEM